MGIENLAEDIIFVDLEREPEMCNQLKEVIELLRQRRNIDVILDFARIDIITSPSLSRLLKLRRQLADAGHRLVFSDVNSFTRGAFKVTGLDGIFEIVEDKLAATSVLHSVG